MKKLLSVVLALVLVLGMSTVAFADVTTYNDYETITITKVYKNLGSTNIAPGVSPEETFDFTIERAGLTDAGVNVSPNNYPVPSVASVTYEQGEAGKVTFEGGVNELYKKDIVVTLPDYNGVGIYKYTINETAKDTAGVRYHADPITLVVTVIEQNGLVRVAAVHTETGENAAKSDRITNEYHAGTLAVTKEVKGNAGDLDKNFDVTVTFTAPQNKVVKAPITYTENGELMSINPAEWVNGVAVVEINLKNDETVRFDNIPEGVTYTVVETQADTYNAPVYEYTGKVYPADGSSSTVDVSEQAIGCVVNELQVFDQFVKITNEKNVNVDTGVILDSLPYVLVLAGAGAVALTMARRKNEEQ